MPQPKGSELGFRNGFRIRVGTDISGFHGINQQDDPGAVQPDQLVNAINVRFDGSRLKERPGLSKVNSGGAASACLFGGFELGGVGTGDVVGNRLLQASTALIVGYDTNGLYKSLWNSYSQPDGYSDQVKVGIPSGKTWIPYLSLDGDFYYIGTNAGIIARGRRDSTIGPSAFLNLGLAGADTTTVAVVGGLRFIGAVNGTTSLVYKWDGSTLSQDHSVAMNITCSAHPLVIALREGVAQIHTYAGTNYTLASDAPPDSFEVRSSSGAWSTVTYGLGGAFYAASASVVSDTLFIGGFTQTVGAALAPHGYIVTSTGGAISTDRDLGANTAVENLFLASDGTLYYTWITYTAGAMSGYAIGKRTSAGAYTDSVCDLWALGYRPAVPPFAGYPHRTMDEFAGEYYLCVQNTTPVSQVIKTTNKNAASWSVVLGSGTENFGASPLGTPADTQSALAI